MEASDASDDPRRRRRRAIWVGLVVGGWLAVQLAVPAIALVNHMRLSDGIAAGMMVTTGTYTGLEFAARGSTVEAIFTGFGSVGCRFSG